MTWVWEKRRKIFNRYLRIATISVSAIIAILVSLSFLGQFSSKTNADTSFICRTTIIHYLNNGKKIRSYNFSSTRPYGSPLILFSPEPFTEIVFNLSYPKNLVRNLEFGARNILYCFDNGLKIIQGEYVVKTSVQYELVKAEPVSLFIRTGLVVFIDVGVFGAFIIFLLLLIERVAWKIYRISSVIFGKGANSTRWVVGTGRSVIKTGIFDSKKMKDWITDGFKEEPKKPD